MPIDPTAKPSSQWCQEFPLRDCRRAASEMHLVAHQEDALGKLTRWYDELRGEPGGGILVLPTGGGKTFTAIQFLCRGPLSDGYKVLWLAHTHHLLEQAMRGFKPALGNIREPRSTLRLRVVSGGDGHFPSRDIKPDDDVVIATLQSIASAQRSGVPALENFLDAANGKLFVVFDEAHHAPAPSYRKLLAGLSERGAPVLGLTATPTYSDVNKQGWLKKLFPQGILAQSRVADLIAAGILAKPVIEYAKTDVAPDFDHDDYEKWVGTYRDIPEEVIEKLAQRAHRDAIRAEPCAVRQDDHLCRSVVPVRSDRAGAEVARCACGRGVLTHRAAPARERSTAAA